MSATTGAGRFVSWTGGCLFIGESVTTIPEHAHYAIQLAFGVRPGIRFYSQGVWCEYGGAIIPSRQPHCMDATGVGMSAVLLIEPETPQGRALSKRYLQSGIVEIPRHALANHAALLFAACEVLDEGEALQRACEGLVQALTGDVDQSLIVDNRILHAVAFINANLAGTLTLSRVASEACLSPSRFRHVFVEVTGMTFQLYVLWRRVMRVWTLLAAGVSLSTAAHAAGFADAAHLTRTSRTMFGFPPSALHIARLRPAVVGPYVRAVSGAEYPRRSAVRPLRTRSTQVARVA